MFIILLVFGGLFLLCVLVGLGSYFLIIKPIQKEEEEAREKQRIQRGGRRICKKGEGPGAARAARRPWRKHGKPRRTEPILKT